MAFVLLAACVISGCNRPVVEIKTTQLLAGNTMGTSYRIKVAPTPGVSLTKLSADIELELEAVNEQMSTYIKDSELSKFNASPSVDSWYGVSAETVQVVKLALEVSRLTDGAFDVTVGKLVNQWGFGPNAQFGAAPSREVIESVRSEVGYQKLSAQESPPALSKSNAALSVDLSAIAKGHGVDRVASVLDAAGVQSYFIEIGGEVRTKGVRQDGQPWRVGIEQPLDDDREIYTALEITDLSLATSGNYRNFYMVDGVRYSHTIDPRTGYPVQAPIASASAIADNCALADAVATSMMCLGVEEGLKVAEENEWAVLLLAFDSGGSLVSRPSTAFKTLYPDWEPPLASEVLSDEGLVEGE